MRTGWTIGRGEGLSLAALIAVTAIALGASSMPAAGQSTQETPAASEVGVTPTEIRIAVIADVGSPFAPGLFAGAHNAVTGFANYVNSSCATKNKCLAGRKLVVDPYDSRLDQNEARNATIQACANDFAMVGTAALLLENVDDMRNCPDKAGATTGIPDIPILQGALAYKCLNESFPIIPPLVRCETKDQHPQTFQVNVARAYYYTKKYPGLHGAYIFSSDPSVYPDDFAGWGILRYVGIHSDADSKVPLVLQQTDFTNIVKGMKDDHSNFATCAVSFQCTVLLRREATLQGLTNQVKVWDCPEQCYDKKFLAQGGADVEGEYVETLFLPFYDTRDRKANRMVANFVHYTGADKVDGFGDNAWAAAVAFRDAVNATVTAHGINGLTRANLLAALNGIHRFDADGMIGPMDLAGRRFSDCHVLMQVRHRNFVRVQPTKPGTYDCNSKYVITHQLDLYNG